MITLNLSSMCVLVGVIIWIGLSVWGANEIFQKSSLVWYEGYGILVTIMPFIPALPATRFLLRDPPISKRIEV